MKPSCGSSNNLTEIDRIHLEVCQENEYYSESSIYDLLKNNPNTIQVNIYHYPDLQPMLSQNSKKYVRYEPNYTGRNNLLKLSR